jgi:hypothetical protein
MDHCGGLLRGGRVRCSFENDDSADVRCGKSVDADVRILNGLHDRGIGKLRGHGLGSILPRRRRVVAMPQNDGCDSGDGHGRRECDCYPLALSHASKLLKQHAT